MSSLDTCASSDVKVDMSEEESSDEDYCEELDVALDLDLSRSSTTCPLPRKMGSPATDPPATDPPGRSNEPSCRL